MADLIVVGAGTAGIPCAIVAAQAGANVAVLEQDSQIGGTLHVSAGHMSGAGSRRQHDVGSGRDTVERHFEDVKRLSCGEADPVLVRVAVEEAPHTIDWLHDLGFTFDPETPTIHLGHDSSSRARGLACGAGRHGAHLNGPRLVTNAWHTATGDGIVAARAVGAAIRGGEKHNYRHCMIETEPGSGRGDMRKDFVNLSTAVRRPDEIWVNLRGEWFADETPHDITSQERTLHDQPEQRFWLVFAEAAVAAKAGISAVGLERTTAASNARVARGEADRLGRTGIDRPIASGPFYALALPAGVLVTFGGIHVDGQLRALGGADRPIPGLNAAASLGPTLAPTAHASA